MTNIWADIAADKGCPCDGTKCINWKVEPPWNAKICQFTHLPAVGTEDQVTFTNVVFEGNGGAVDPFKTFDCDELAKQDAAADKVVKGWPTPPDVFSAHAQWAEPGPGQDAGWDMLPAPSAPIAGLAGLHNRAHDIEGEVRWPADVVEQHNRGTKVQPQFVFTCISCEAEHCHAAAKTFSYGLACLENDGWLFRWNRSQAGYTTWCPSHKHEADKI